MNGRPTGISAFNPVCAISAWRAVNCAESWTRRMREPLPAANITAVSIVRAHMESNDRVIASPIETRGHVDEHVGEEIPRNADAASPESRGRWEVVDWESSRLIRIVHQFSIIVHRSSVSIEVRTICRSGSSLLRGCRPVRTRLAKLAGSGLEDSAPIQLWPPANARDCGCQFALADDSMSASISSGRFAASKDSQYSTSSGRSVGNS